MAQLQQKIIEYLQGRYYRAVDVNKLEQAGVTCIEATLAQGDFSGVPTDVDYVLTTREIGVAMLEVARQGYGKHILETRDIHAMARR